MAAVEVRTGPEVYTTLIGWLVSTGQLGGLPTQLFSYVGSLVSRTSIAEAYQSLLDQDPGDWASLWDMVLRRAEEPNHLRRSSSVLREFLAAGGPEAFLDRLATEAADMTDEDHEIVLQLYLDQSYVEAGGGRPDLLALR